MAQPYRTMLAKAMNKEVDWDSDAFKLTLHTSSYTPNLDTHDYVDDLSAELSTAGGYTAGGYALTLAAPAYTAADSWATTRANSTAYAVGDVVRPSTGNGWLYQCVVAGTSAGSAPTWPTVIGTTVTDGSVTWAAVGKGILIFDGTDVSAGSFSAGPFRYGVISDRTAGTAATQPLIALIDYGSNQTGGGGTFSEVWSALGVFHMFLP